jgi:hypothetical protein
VTRPQGPDVLPGVTRDTLADLAQTQGFRIEHRAFSPEEARRAPELFYTAASAFVTPVVRLDGVAIGHGPTWTRGAQVAVVISLSRSEQCALSRVSALGARLSSLRNHKRGRRPHVRSRQEAEPSGHLPEQRPQIQDAADHLPGERRQAAGRGHLVRQFLRLLRREGQSQLVYKHAISTIMPAQPVQLYEPEQEDEDT